MTLPVDRLLRLHIDNGTDKADWPGAIVQFDQRVLRLFNGTPHKERRREAASVLEQLGLADRLAHRPSDLSGGEQQRVAVARAIVKRPEILFADEPTGNLDYENAQQIITLLTALNARGLTIVMVTHNLEMAQQYAHRTIRMQYGRIVGDEPTGVLGGTR